METTVHELKANLSEFLRRAVEGEEVLVAMRGKPLVRLVPVVTAKSPEEVEREALARLDAMPWITAGDGGTVRGSDRPIAWATDASPLSR